MLIKLTQNRFPLKENIGEGPYTSLWTSSSGVREVDNDIEKLILSFLLLNN